MIMRGFETCRPIQHAVMTDSAALQSKERKRELYEYMLKGFVDWFCERKNLTASEFNSQNDLSKLKIVKLTFFASAIKFGPREESDLLDIFDNFHAMPLGPIESDLLDAHNNGTIQRFVVDNKCLIIKEEGSLKGGFDKIDPAQKDEIDSAIKELKKVNPGLIGYYARQLVGISHEWSCWKYQFEIAKSLGRLSYPISKDRIRQDTPLFY
jgi:uncharacterized phage-associated protein